MKTTEKAEQALTRILEAFETGDVAPALAKAMLPRVDVPSTRWSLNNRMLAALQGTLDARGFRQWKEVGRHPKKGSRAFYILAPMVGKRKAAGAEMDAESEPETVVYGFKAVPVFAMEDTDGEPVYPELLPNEPPPLTDVAERWGVRVDYLPGGGSAMGFYQPSRNRIGLSTHDDGTWFHELAHAAHARILGPLKPGQDWKQEVTAELTSAVLRHVYGSQENDGGSYQYIRAYASEAGRDAHRACLAVLSDVQTILSAILDETRHAIAA